MEETVCSDCIHSRMSFSEDQEMPVFKCHRYPPALMWDPKEECVVQGFPDAWRTCGEYDAGNTPHVIGTLRKVKEHARSTWNAFGRHLHRIRGGRGNHQSGDQADPSRNPEAENEQEIRGTEA